MSAESAHLSTFGAETETEAEIRSTSNSHHLSLSQTFTPDLKLISFTNLFLHSHSYLFRTAFTDLEPVLNQVGTGVCLFVLVSSFYIFVSGYVC